MRTKYERQETGSSKCNVCLVFKSVTHFSVNRNNKNGLRSHCRDCDSKRRSAWSKCNPERVKELKHRRRAIKKRAYVEEFSLEEFIASQDGKCVYCGDDWEHLDHIMPLAKGGAHTPGNLALACASCNLSKGDRLLSEWQDGKYEHLFPVELTQREETVSSDYRCTNACSEVCKVHAYWSNGLCNPYA